MLNAARRGLMRCTELKSSHRIIEEQILRSERVSLEFFLPHS